MAAAESHYQDVSGLRQESRITALRISGLTFAVVTYQTARYCLRRKYHIGERKSEPNLPVPSRSNHAIPIFLELLFILAGLVLALHEWMDVEDKYKTYAVLIVVNWLYILFLWILRTSHIRLGRMLKYHLLDASAGVYVVYWLGTLRALLHAIEQIGPTAAVTPMALETFLLSVLAGIVLRTPRTVIGVHLNNTIEASLVYLATFSWLDPMIWKGYSRRLQTDDMWDLNRSDSSRMASESFDKSSSKSLIRRFLLHVNQPLATQAVFSVGNAIMLFLPTVFMGHVLAFLETADSSASPIAAYSGLSIVLVCGLVTAISESQTTWLGQKIACQLRAIIISQVYDKILKKSMPSVGLAATVDDAGADDHQQRRADTGTIVNLISSDAQNVADTGAKTHEMVSVLVQVIVAIALLFRILGLSAFAGVSMMLLVTPLNSIIWKHLGKAMRAAATASDERVEETNQMLRHIRTIKYFVWEQHFGRRVLERRDKELSLLQTRLMWWSIAATVWYAVPFLITLLSFLSFTVLQRQELVPSTAFEVLSLFNLLKAPLDQLIGMFGRVQASMASIRRIEAFLEEDEVIDTPRNVYDIHGAQKDKDLLGFENATLSWTGKIKQSSESSFWEQQNGLFGISARLAPRRLNIVTGPTGSGKTSLLLALLGEMTLENGQVFKPHAAVAYCAQEAWLINDTLRNNIVFKSSWDSHRYNEVVRQCGLVPDLELLEAGDSTLVGEKGFSLSGGQKQRVALARAVYSHCQCVLLDDCFSAVDYHTAAFLVENCIKGSLMASRTCILVTHVLSLTAPYASYLVALDRGRVVASGRPKDVLADPALSSVSQSLELINASAGSGIERESKQVAPEKEFLPETPPPENRKRIPEKPGEKTPTKSEEQERPAGQIPLPVIGTYLRAMGGRWYWLAIAFFFASQQTVALLANWWLMKFSDTFTQDRLTRIDPPSGQAESGTLYFRIESLPLSTILYHISGYALIITIYSAVSFGRMYMASLGSITASRSLHKRLLTSMLGATFRYYDSVTHGTLLNRFSQDISTVDTSVVPMALGTMHFLLAMIVFTAMITYLTPRFLVPGAVILFVYMAVGRLYLDTSIELKRMEADARAPLYQHAGESIIGAVTLRAYRLQDRFIAENQAKIDAVNRPSLWLAAADSWLSFRLSIIGTVLSFITGFIAISSVGKVSAGVLALSLSYSATFSENVLWLVKYHSLNQQNFAAVERIADCFEIEQERPSGTRQDRAPPKWPVSPSIRFRDFSCRYRDNLPLVLRNINIDIAAGEKIGVVGRTGAGKSSLANALLRVLNASNGKIFIDDLDISTVALDRLRQAIVFVPQDPVLFAGTLASNLDPSEQHSRARMRQALQKVHLVVDTHKRPPKRYRRRNVDNQSQESNPGEDDRFANLEMQIDESGSNISQGQRQLICLARAFLREAKIVILDEATASIDPATDQVIQDAVREIDGTLITIAHRLRTIADYDKILVMAEGEVKEYGQPWQLLQEGGLYRELCKNPNEYEELQRLARLSSARTAAS